PGRRPLAGLFRRSLLPARRRPRRRLALRRPRSVLRHPGGALRHPRPEVPARLPGLGRLGPRAIHHDLSRLVLRPRGARPLQGPHPAGCFERTGVHLPDVLRRGPHRRRARPGPLQHEGPARHDDHERRHLPQRRQQPARPALAVGGGLRGHALRRGAGVTSAALLSGAVLLFGAAPANPLTQLAAALKALTARVSPAVVQVLVTGYGPAPSRSAGDAVLYTRQQGLGSGVVLDPSGYIITNAHVVKGAERVQVVFTKPDRSARAVPPVDEEAVLPATVVGLTDYFDLALLKVEATGLPSLPFADFHTVTQGQVVVAVGSPLGLDNSVTMGVVSSVARQARPDSPIVYVQTDAPINPGNSGGALVDVEGRLVGINTLILSQTGGNEG